MNADSLPIPKVWNAFHPAHARTAAKVTGIGLLGMWLLLLIAGIIKGGLPLDFTGIWMLLGGAGLTVMGFLDLKRTLVTVISMGIGFIGLISMMLTLQLIPFGYAFGLLGMATTSFALFYWIRNGHSQLAWITLIVGLSLMLVSLLVPVGITGMPLVGIFTVFGKWPFILGAIFVLLFGLAYIGLIAGGVIFGVLPQANAEEGWLKLLAVATLFYLPAAYIVVCFFTFVASFPLLGAVMAILSGAYLYLTVSGAVQLVEAIQDGSVGDWF